MSLWRWLVGFVQKPTPLARILAGSRVFVRGKVVPRDLIDSPLSGESCVYYRFFVEDFRPTSVTMLGGNEGQWHLAEQDEAAAEFYLDDGTARALVFPGEAEVDHGRFLPERMTVGASRRGTEWRIHPGDVVEVTGIAEPITDPLDDARGYRDAPARIVLRGWGRSRLRIRVVERPTLVATRNDSE